MARQAQCHRVRSLVTPKGNLIKAKNVNVHAELPKLTSGQLPFLGSKQRKAEELALTGKPIRIIRESDFRKLVRSAQA